MNEPITWEADAQEYSLELPTGGCSEPSVTVIETVARIDETPVERLAPLSESVDPDALDDMFSDDSPDCRVQFRYEDYRITLIDGEELRVAPIEAHVETKLAERPFTHH